jgi:hypothetical protein
MATLAVTLIDRNGVAMDLAVAASSADKFLNTGKELLVVVNADGSPHTVTVATPYTLDGKAVGPRTIVVAAGASVIAGPFPPALHNDVDGYVNLTYTSITGMAVCPLKYVPL